MKYVKFSNGQIVYQEDFDFMYEGLGDLVDGIVKGLYNISGSGGVLWGLDVSYSNDTVYISPGVAIVVGAGDREDGFNKYHILNSSSQASIDISSLSDGIYYVYMGYHYAGSGGSDSKLDLVIDFNIDTSVPSGNISLRQAVISGGNVTVDNNVKDWVDIKMQKLIDMRNDISTNASAISTNASAISDNNQLILENRKVLGYDRLFIIDSNTSLSAVQDAIYNGNVLFLVTEDWHITDSIKLWKHDAPYLINNVKFMGVGNYLSNPVSIIQDTNGKAIFSGQDGASQDGDCGVNNFQIENLKLSGNGAKVIENSFTWDNSFDAALPAAAKFIGLKLRDVYIDGSMDYKYVYSEGTLIENVIVTGDLEYDEVIGGVIASLKVSGNVNFVASQQPGGTGYVSQFQNLIDLSGAFNSEGVNSPIKDFPYGGGLSNGIYIAGNKVGAKDLVFNFLKTNFYTDTNEIYNNMFWRHYNVQVDAGFCIAFIDDYVDGPSGLNAGGRKYAPLLFLVSRKIGVDIDKIATVGVRESGYYIYIEYVITPGDPAENNFLVYNNYSVPMDLNIVVLWSDISGTF